MIEILEHFIVCLKKQMLTLRCGIYIPCRSFSIASFYFDANVRKTPLQNCRTCDCGCFV